MKHACEKRSKINFSHNLTFKKVLKGDHRLTELQANGSHGHLFGDIQPMVSAITVLSDNVCL